MKYSLDTNALIAITKSDDLTQDFIDLVSSKNEDSFFIVYYVAEEFESFFKDKKSLTESESTELKNYKRLREHGTAVVFSDIEFFTLNQSVLNGSDILASGVSNFAKIDTSRNKYKSGGSQRPYKLWKRSRLNDRLISEMSEANYCDAIITDNIKHFKKIPTTYSIKIIGVYELFPEKQHVPL